MASQGDDCYFFYYSTCAKGEDCPFRHQPAALGSERTCDQWAKGVCTRGACKFRHMVIEKNRSQIPCFWESQLTGCLKPHCSFFHTRPRSIDTAPIPVAANNPPVNKVELNTAVTVASVPPASEAAMRIPTISSQPRPRMPALPQATGTPRPSVPLPPAYPPIGTRQVVAAMIPSVPHSMIRAPEFTGPPRPAGMIQPVSVMTGMPSGLSGAPLRYGRGIATPQQSHPLLYQGRPAGSSLPFLPASRLHAEDNRFDQEESDSYSSSGSEEERRRSYSSSRHREHGNPHRQVSTSNRREIRTRKQQSSKHAAERDRSNARQRSNRARDRNKSVPETENERSRIKNRHPVKPRRQEKDATRDRESVQEKEASDSKDGETENKKEKSDETDTSNKSPPLKIKTLEEILREKALKKLEERRAQNKLSTEKKTESSNAEEVSKGNTDTNETQQVKETMAITKISEAKSLVSNAEPSVKNKGTPLQLITTKKASVDGENVTEAATKEPPSPFQQVKVKSFEEIMQEKRKRKQEALKEGTAVSNKQSAVSSEGQADDKNSTSSNPVKRIKRIVRRASGGSEGDTKAVTSCEGKVQSTRSRTVFMVDKTSPTKQNIESSVVTIAATKMDTDTQHTSPKKDKVAETLRSKRLNVKGFEEVMEEKRMRKAQKSVEIQEGAVATVEETPKVVSAQLKKHRTGNPPRAAAVIKPRRIKVWARSVTQTKPKEDAVSGVIDSPLQEQETGVDSLKSDNTTDKAVVAGVLSANTVAKPALKGTELSQSETAGEATFGICSKDIQDTHVVEPVAEVIPDKGSINSKGSSDEEIPDLSDNTEKCEVNMVIKQVPTNYDFEEILDSEESQSDLSSDQTALKDGEQGMSQRKEPPSYDEIKQAITNEMAKKFDPFGDDIDIDLGDDGEDIHAHDLNEDDLLMELDEMINQ